MGQCTAKSKQSGERCKSPPVPGRAVCRIHGGKGGRPITVGRYSKCLPIAFADKYEEIRQDTELISLREEIALVGVFVAELLPSLQGGPAWERALELYEEAMQKQDTGALRELGDVLRAGLEGNTKRETLMDLLERRRRLCATEAKREADMQAHLTAPQAMALLAAVVALIRENVTDPNVLREISTGIAGLSNRISEPRALPAN